MTEQSHTTPEGSLMDRLAELEQTVAENHGQATREMDRLQKDNARTQDALRRIADEIGTHHKEIEIPF